MLAALTAALAVAGSGNGFGRQDDPDKDNKKKVKVERPGERGKDERTQVKQNLFLVLKASPDETEDSLRKLLVKGLKAANCKYSAIVIEPMSISTYNELDKVINKGVLPSITVSGAAGTGPVRISPTTVDESAMVFRFSDEYRDLQSLELEFTGGKKVPVKLLPRGTVSPPLPALVEGEVPGQYILKLDPKADPPLRYSVQIKNVKKKASALETLTGDFPKSPRCFMVLIENFEGERVELFNTLKDKNAVADPLDDINVSTEVRIAFASWKTGSVGPGVGWNQTRYTMQVEGLQRRRTARVWVLFPIKEAEVDKLLGEYRGFDSEELIRKIDAEAKSTKTDGVAEIPFGGSIRPAWVLLNGNKPPSEESTIFTRTFALDGTQLAQIKANFPKVYRLTVWEFEGAGSREAIPVQDEVTKSRVLVVKQEVKEWVPGITALK